MTDAVTGACLRKKSSALVDNALAGTITAIFSVADFGCELNRQPEK